MTPCRRRKRIGSPRSRRTKCIANCAGNIFKSTAATASPLRPAAAVFLAPAAAVFPAAASTPSDHLDKKWIAGRAQPIVGRMIAAPTTEAPLIAVQPIVVQLIVLPLVMIVAPA